MFGHLVVVVAILTCLWLGDWQWFRAETTGSVQNWGYALQWPLFAVCFAVGWWRMLRLESRRMDELAAETAGETAAASAVPVENSVEKSAGVVEDPNPPVVNIAEPVEKAAESVDKGAGAAEHPAVTVEKPAAPPEPAVDDEDPGDAALAAYNRMLRELAERDAAARR